FSPRPNQFVGIDVRCVGRQTLCLNLGMSRQKISYQLRLVMDLAAVPDYREGAAKLCLQMPQVGDDVLGMHIGVVRQQIKMKVQPPVTRADRDTADGRDAVTTIPGIKNRRLATRRPGSTHAGVEHKAGFIEKNQVRAPFLRGSRDAWEVAALPVEDCLLVAFARPPFRFLRRPAEPVAQKAANVIVMKAQLEMP